MKKLVLATNDGEPTDEWAKEQERRQDWWSARTREMHPWSANLVEYRGQVAREMC